jgi:hypothetical protein
VKPARHAFTKKRVRSLAGYRTDLPGIYFRSAWEANYARYLNLLIKTGAIKAWQYEPTTFWFDGIKRGTNNYKPDFRVEDHNGESYFVEVKGYMDAKSKTKIKRMAKYHPEINLVVVDAKVYRGLKAKLAGVIRNWE